MNGKIELKREKTEAGRTSPLESVDETSSDGNNLHEYNSNQSALDLRVGRGKLSKRLSRLKRKKGSCRQQRFHVSEQERIFTLERSA